MKDLWYDVISSRLKKDLWPSSPLKLPELPDDIFERFLKHPGSVPRKPLACIKGSRATLERWFEQLGISVVGGTSNFYGEVEIRTSNPLPEGTLALIDPESNVTLWKVEM